MFHVEHGSETLDAVERWLGVPISSSQWDSLLRFERWLEQEAVPAGGVGPAEGKRLFDRHIVDSLAFQKGIPERAETAIDIGGGVGLPSIPLAIVRPDIRFTLIDRSQRRTDLASRAARILGLTNYSVLTMDVSHGEPTSDVALFRASLPILPAAEALPRCVAPSGVGLFAVSRHTERPSLPNAPEGITFALSHEGDGVLVSPFWLLTMRYR